MIKDRNIADRISDETNVGYWSVNDNTFFFKKYEALQYAGQQQIKKVQYHYFDQFYKNLNWSIEPSQSLDQLYKLRAQSLRDKYDYLVLAYSGGSDSTNILQTFVKNNIKLDEVVTSYPRAFIKKLLPKFDGQDKFHGNTIFEYYTAALPRLKWLANACPDITITDLDTTEFIENLALSGNMFDFACAGWPPTFSTSSTYNRIFLHMRDRSASGKKICLITGVDKPRLGFNPIDQIWGMFFQDVQFAWHTGHDVLSEFRPTVEHFYFNRDVPEITIKQCAELLKFLNPIFRNPDKSLSRSYIHYISPRGHEIIDVHQEWAKHILYSGWDSNIFQSDKPRNVGQGDGPSYYLYNSDLLDKKSLDFARGQLNDWHNSIGENVKFKDPNGRVRTWHYNSQPINLSFN